MIPNQWYAILESREVQVGRPVGVLRMGERLVLWRAADGQVVCQRDCCAHRGAALSAGGIHHGHVRCPFHGLEYDALGRCQLIPANGRVSPVPERFSLHTYPTAEEHGFIYIWWGEPQIDLPNVPFFTDIDDTFTYVTVRDSWRTHYSRAIENQLDVMHLPFVHPNTIGRGGRTLVDGPRFRWVNEDLMFVYVYNRVDDGTSPLKPEDLPPGDPTFHLEFQFPHLWENYLGHDVRIVVAFVPVDDEHTILYLRFYQRFVRFPILRDIVTWLAMPSNLYILHQDRRVVETQRPKETALAMGENLIQGDRPIIAYRTRRQQLLDRART